MTENSRHANPEQNKSQLSQPNDELKQLKQRLSLALEAGEVGVWDWNLHTDFCWRSLKHDQIFGYATAVVDWNFEIFLSHIVPEDRHIAQQAFKRHTEANRFDFEVRIKTTSDAPKWIAVVGESFVNEQGVAERYIGTVVDITGRKQQAEMQCVKAVLSERDNFIAMLTHDMKNPLIGGNRLLELLSSGQLGEVKPEHKELLEGLHKSNCGLLNIVRDLADFYRLDKDVESLMLEPSNLRDMLEACIEKMESLARSRGINISTKFSDQSSSVIVDRARVERLIQNLMDNAVKFVNRDGTVRVSLLAEGPFSVMEFENDGPPIPEEELLKLFQKFAQGSVGRAHTGGSGLGLYLCKQIAEAHGGSIECKSTAGASTTFRVLLPSADLSANMNASAHMSAN